MKKPWEEFRESKGWRKVATGAWFYDGTIPKPVAIWAKPAAQSAVRYDDNDQLVESRPVPDTKDGYLYCTDTGLPEFLTMEEAKACADAQPWGPVKWN
ncbi:MAG: hypothetical protein H0U98_13055 [Alphaproteobacteria bacterium]|nr:hypothetical protein [Alphaproteobacteria bacterium]